MKNTLSNFEIYTKVVASKGYPIVVGMSESVHTVKRYEERGGIASLDICLNNIAKQLKSRPDVMTLLAELHLKIETNKKSIALNMPNGEVYVLQYGGFVDFMEAFDYVTYYNEVFCCCRFHANAETIVVKVCENDGPIYVNNIKWTMPDLDIKW